MFPWGKLGFFVLVVGVGFIRAKQSLICLVNPDHTGSCCHYEPFKTTVFELLRQCQKRAFLESFHITHLMSTTRPFGFPPSVLKSPNDFLSIEHGIQ